MFLATGGDCFYFARMNQAVRLVWQRDIWWKTRSGAFSSFFSIVGFGPGRGRTRPAVGRNPVCCHGQGKLTLWMILSFAKMLWPCFYRLFLFRQSGFWGSLYFCLIFGRTGFNFLAPIFLPPHCVSCSFCSFIRSDWSFCPPPRWFKKFSDSFCFGSTQPVFLLFAFCQRGYPKLIWAVKKNNPPPWAGRLLLEIGEGKKKK